MKKRSTEDLWRVDNPWNGQAYVFARDGMVAAEAVDVWVRQQYHAAGRTVPTQTVTQVTHIADSKKCLV